MKNIACVFAMVIGGAVLLVGVMFLVGAMAAKTNFVPGMITFCVGGVVACGGFVFHGMEVVE